MNKLVSMARTLLLVGGISAAAYLPFALQAGALNVPFLAPSSYTQTVTTSAPKASAHHGDTAWSYDFATKPDGALPSKDWNFEVGPETADYNNEAQTYTARTANARIKDGVLIIEAKREQLDGKQFTSARINTKDKFDFKYGTMEVVMKLPAGRGNWPAAWLLPADPRYKPADYGISKSDKFAWALNGEIDFGEAIGAIPGENIPAAHSYNEIQRDPTYTPAYIPDSTTAYHRYGVIKTPTKITFTMDGVPYASREKTSDDPREWPYDQPYYLILNLAVGGSWAGYKGIDAESAPWQLMIKSISYKPL